ncbi:TPA_asm: UL52.4 sORF [Human alphaherpesvirus 1]|nr:TPA_asm: UL52.4 sORF [Human alphaherpesvirus 1]
MATVRARIMFACSANVASASRVAAMWSGCSGVPCARASCSAATSSARSKRQTNMGRVRPRAWWVPPTSVPNKQKVTRKESPFSPPDAW